MDFDIDTLGLLVDIYVKEKDPGNVQKYAYRIINGENDPGVLTKLGIQMAQYNRPWTFRSWIVSPPKVLHVAPDYKKTLIWQQGHYLPI